MNKLNYKMIPASLYYALICVVSSLSINVNIHNVDKGLHTIEYSILGLLLAFGFNLTEFKLNKFLFRLLLVGLLLGCIDEIHQHFVPGRSMDIFDVCADITGITLGSYIFTLSFPFISKLIEVKNK
ncbi:MAG: VanZ family protein [bacterium]